MNEDQISTEALQHYIESLRALSHCDLTGAYLYGSIASGCANSRTSDVDIVLVVRSVCTPEAVGELERLHRLCILPIDATIVTEEHLTIDRLSAPVCFLIKPDSSGTAIFRTEGSPDFVVQSQEVYERGIALLGPEPRDLFQPVPWNLVVRYVEYLQPFISSHFKDPVLMLCRCACTIVLREMCSKREAGQWALAQMATEWSSLIADALAQYSGDADLTQVNHEKVLQFDTYVSELISEAINGKT